MKQQKGALMVELILAVSILSIILLSTLAGLSVSVNAIQSSSQQNKASFLLQEEMDPLTTIRNHGWSSIGNGTYYVAPLGNSWQLTATTSAEAVGQFTRNVVISDVNRNSNGQIVVSGGILDPSTKKATATVFWQTGTTAHSLSAFTYLTRYQNNLTWTQTTQADFNGGTKISTTVTNTSGGEVTLASAGHADWCNPQLYIVNQLTLPKLSNALYARQDGVYLGSGDGTNNSPEFINVSITTPPPPSTPTASVAGTFNGTATTNSIYSDGTYMYLSTTATTEQVVILNTSVSPYTQVGTVTVPGGLGANSVYLSNNILFVTSGNSLYTFDVTTKTGSHTTVLSSIQMIAGIWARPTARQVVVVNNHAYVGTGGSFLGLQMFSFSSNGKNLSFQSAALLTFSQQSQGLYVDPTEHYAYTAFNNSNGSFSKGFFVVDLTQTNWFFITYYPTYYTYNSGGTDPRGITVPASNRAIVVGVGGTKQYQVVDTSNLASLTSCGGLPITNGVFGVSSILDQYGNAYSYITSGEANNQFKIIQGGSGGSSFASYGTFESSTLDANHSTSFNRFNATINSPTQTNITFQVAGADAVDGNCNGATFNFVGPDATGATYFATTSAAIPLSSGTGYKNPDQCFRYKAYLTTSDTTKTPALDDFTLNYSP